MEKHQGVLVVISSPSGGGKNSVIRELLERIPDSVRLVTTTSRSMRPGEVDGVDYHFLTREVFEQQIKQETFIEWAEYAGNLYGMQRTHVDEAMDTHAVIFANPDVQGKETLDRLGIPHIAIFLAPDDVSVLKKRILERGGTDLEAAEERVEIAEEEMKKISMYDAVVVNREGDMMGAVQGIIDILAKKGISIES